MSTEKAMLRARLKKGRLAMNEKLVAERSRAITNRLQQVVDWSNIKSVHCYEPISRLHEVNIVPFIEFLKNNHPKIILYTSVEKSGEWRIVGLGGRKPNGQPLIDLFIVPMLGFDPRSLHRIGYGGGYYDRLLAGYPGAQKIGVCFQEGMVKSVPAESHDVPMDKIVSERAIYRS